MRAHGWLVKLTSGQLALRTGRRGASTVKKDEGKTCDPEEGEVGPCLTTAGQLGIRVNSVAHRSVFKANAIMSCCSEEAGADNHFMVNKAVASYSSGVTVDYRSGAEKTIKCR